MINTHREKQGGARPGSWGREGKSGRMTGLVIRVQSISLGKGEIMVRLIRAVDYFASREITT